MDGTSATCRFCDRYGPEGNAPAEPWDVPLVATEDFVVVPTKGALVPGWALVIPRTHILSFASLHQALHAELNEVLAQAEEGIASAYGPCTLFEHGAATHGTAFGCGIDHAHLHIAPLSFSLLAAAATLDPHTQWSTSVAPWMYASDANAYLAVREPAGRWFTSQPEQLPSQFMRRAIAQAIGKPALFAYDDYPHPEVAAELVRRFERAQVSTAA